MINIARCVKPASSQVFDPHAFIYHEPDSRLQADAFESNILGAWQAPRSGQNLIGKKRSSVAERKASHTVVLTIHQSDSRFGKDRNSFLLE